MLNGSPDGAGLYAINVGGSRAHPHRSREHMDDRVAPVFSGTWFIGYGD